MEVFLSNQDLLIISGPGKNSLPQINPDIIENPYYGDADDLHDEKGREESREEAEFIAVTKVHNVYYDE